jgi:hypothetical protein
VLNGAAPSNHAADGRFQVGNKAGVGNPHNRRIAQLKSELLCVAEGRLPKVVAALYAKAEVGDVPSAELILRYSLGRPSPAVDVDRVTSGLDEVALLMARPYMTEVLLAALEAMEPSVAAEYLRLANASHGDPTACVGTPGEDDPDADPDDGAGVTERFQLLATLRTELLRARAARS